uniref:Polyketide synthase n=1 Tax=Peronospora matthiolae TaxID=2874970 RepID=A0AAV1UT29_9STRA
MLAHGGRVSVLDACRTFELTGGMAYSALKVDIVL